MVERKIALIITKIYKRGVCRLVRQISDAEWFAIEGVLNLPPQKGILIPKML
jgi:hypothetical protein